MTLETFVAIVGAIGTVIGYAVYRYFEENVYLTYKEQRIPDINKKEKRK